MNQKVIIESMAMDLKRVALGLHRGSENMAKRFKEEALKRANELENEVLNDYLKNLVSKIKKTLNATNERIAEDALMYSTLLQNFVLKNYK